MTERRTARRYDLSLPVSVRVSVEDKAVLHTGKTRDISTRGVYFVFDNGIDAGAELDLTMTLPAEVTGGTDVLIRALGKAVRVDDRPDGADHRVGVAVVIERYEIIRREDSSSF
jgi:hypothetical protein